MPHLIAVGISHKTAPVEQREKVALTETTARTISLTNPALEPWTANSYGAALEYYFSERSAGVVSARVYRRDIRNFWGTTLTPATDALLEQLNNSGTPPPIEDVRPGEGL